MRLAPQPETEQPTQNDRDLEQAQEAKLLRERIEELAAATGVGRRPRVAFEDQLLRLMPAAAEEYRLVMGLDPLTNVPQLTPPTDVKGWRIMPLEAPNDPRLLPGQHYRILWFDRHQREVPPLDIEPTPALHFFLGPPDAVVTPEQQECRRLQATNLQLQRQVRCLEKELTEAKQATKQAEKHAQKIERKARKKIKTMKAKHRSDSVKKLFEKWGIPVLAFAAAYFVGKGVAGAEKARAESADSPASQNPPQADEASPSENALAVLAAEERRHPLSVSFEMLSKVVPSEQAEPDAKALSGMSEPELWSLIGDWLEQAKQTTKATDSVRAGSPRSMWTKVCSVADAAGAVQKFRRVIMQINEAPDKPSQFSVSENEMALFDCAGQLHERLEEFVSKLDEPDISRGARIDELRTIAMDLESQLRTQRPQAGERLGQVLHDALNAVRLRLLRTVWLLEQSQKQAPTQPDPLSLVRYSLLRLAAQCTESYIDDRFGIKLDIPLPPMPGTRSVGNTGAAQPKKRGDAGLPKATVAATPKASDSPGTTAAQEDKRPTTSHTEAPPAVQPPSIAIEKESPMTEEQILNFFRKDSPAFNAGPPSAEPDAVTSAEPSSMPASSIQAQPMTKERIAAFFTPDGFAQSPGSD
jgi:hypothetical protein